MISFDLGETLLKEDEKPDFDISKALIKGSELIKHDIKVEWVIEGLLPMQSITLFSAKGGSGKTTITMQMCNAIARGSRFFDLETRTLPCIYVDHENPLPITRERVITTAAHDVWIWHSTSEIRPPMIDGKDWEFFKLLPQNALIVFDTLRTSQSGDENDSKYMAFVMQRFKELRDMGFTIIILHHTPKTNDRIYKGSTCIFDLSDHVLSLYKVQQGTDKEVDDDNDKDVYYRFGTRDKTRYKPFHCFVEFDPTSECYIQADDPLTESLVSIQKLLTEHGPCNQKTLYERAQEHIGFGRKDKFIKLLQKGEGKYWDTHKDKGAIYYHAI